MGSNRMSRGDRAPLLPSITSQWVPVPSISGAQTPPSAWECMVGVMRVGSLGMELCPHFHAGAATSAHPVLLLETPINIQLLFTWCFFKTKEHPIAGNTLQHLLNNVGNPEGRISRSAQ